MSNNGHKFKPGERVLVRDTEFDEWRFGLFSHMNDKRKVYRYVCVGATYSCCIPYKGNEHLLGTKDAAE